MVRKSILLFCIVLLCLYGQSFGIAPSSISGEITYNGCRDGDIRVVAFIGQECHGGIEYDVTLKQPGPYILYTGIDQYSVCACMDVDGSGGCGNDEMEPRGRYPVTLNIQSIGGITDIDIELIDPVPCGSKAAAVPTLSYFGTLIFFLVMIGSAVWFIRRRNKVS